ncbi:MAG: M14 family metallopeptidase, partial [Flavobacteriaceae bacterium]|nr:M14 family metallopeptidase [Flavobacteriaceae bacterium]
PKNKILINNGIHPGEPDGIDASMAFIRDIVQNNGLKKKFGNIVICIIPIYNVGGSLNRNSTSRVNQNGPLSYGFRGNARNYDLNRDFIKNDTKNAQTFAKIFHLIDPDIFIDNHVSNGADYQYSLTHLFTQHNKLGGELGDFLNNKMIPDFVKSLENKNLIITPYVNVFNRVPDMGFSQFLDTPRYSTGYTTLFNTLGFMVETHMLKPYDQRVKGTYEILFSTLEFLKENGDEISKIRKKASSNIFNKKTYPIQWEIDSSKTSNLNFKGYEGNFIESEVTGLKRLKYDRSKPFTKSVTYYNYFKPKKEIYIPEAYIISKGNWKIINQLELNNIEFQEIKSDTLISVETYQIEDYQTVKKPFEGHYLHYNTKVSKSFKKVTFHKGDLIVYTQQNGIRYLMETLEPEAPDSF